MAITCEDCGRCCDQEGAPPFGPGELAAAGQSPLPPEALALLAGVDADDRYRRRLPCLWYDEAAKRCRHYDHRPRACREFAVGDYYCLSYRMDDGNGRVPLPLW